MRGIGAPLNRVVLVLFLFSGATGLVYQVIWLRMLGLVFGHTVYAVATVLAAFMSGLALGSFVFARRATRIRNLIRAYGWLEVAVGSTCALVPFLLGLAAHAYVALNAAFELSSAAFGVLQFALVFLLLLGPTTLMGGTLPVLSQALATDERRLGRTVGGLYAVNTLGAVGGVLAAGYGLLPAFGNSTTIAIAATVNIAIGVLALALGGRWAIAGARGAESGGEVPISSWAQAPAPVTQRGVRATLLALAVSGAVSMVYEVAWTRALALVVGNSTYAFTAMLVAFLVGIAGGSALYSGVWGARRATAATFAALQAGIAGAAVLTVLLFERLPEVFLAAFRWSHSPGFVQFVQFVVSASALLPFTLFLGATFPCAVAVASRGAARIGRDVGHVYAVNTVGAIVGTVAAGFGLIPALGVHGAICAGIVTNLLLAAALAIPWAARATVRRSWRWGLVGAALAGAAAVPFLPPWHRSVMSAGTAVYAKGYLAAGEDRALHDLLRTHEVLFYRDGLNDTVAVTRSGEHLMLRVNGKIDAGTDVDMQTQMMSGHLALLLHPAPRRVLVIGMGSGVTAGAVARHPIERLDIVEIEPAVLEASRYFASVHGNVLEDPRVRPIVADARNFLVRTTERYDVIVSEPSNPWIGGVASLFTTEFFQLARDHLQPDGLMVQWLQGYSLDPDDLRMVVRTFRGAFPATEVWNTIKGDFLLVGRAAARPIDLALLRERYRANRGLRADLTRLGARSWAATLAYFMLGEEDVGRLVEGARLNDEDHLPLEFSAPRALYHDTAESNWQLLRSFRTAVVPRVTEDSRAELERPEFRFAIGGALLDRGLAEDALAQFEAALRADPAYVPAMVGASSALLRLDAQPRRALELAQRALERDPGFAVACYVAGLASQAVDEPERAIEYFERAVALDPANPEFRAVLARAREPRTRG